MRENDNDEMRRGGQSNRRRKEDRDLLAEVERLRGVVEDLRAVCTRVERYGTEVLFPGEDMPVLVLDREGQKMLLAALSDQ